MTSPPDRDEAQNAAGHALASGEEVSPRELGDEALAVLLARKSSQRGKFRVAYAVLALLALAAVAAFVGLLLRGGPAEARPWSSFQPAASGIGAAQEVAAFVESRYLAEDGTPLVDVSADWLALQSEPIDFVAVEQPDINGRTDQVLIPVTAGVRFGLCGEGDKCAITSGEASPERGRYLRRASLELALYTFRYMPDVESVVAYLPPPAGTEPTWAVFFQRSELAPLLERPLEELLAPATPASAAELDAAEAALIDELTLPATFTYGFSETEEAETVLRLVAPTDE